MLNVNQGARQSQSDAFTSKQGSSQNCNHRMRRTTLFPYDSKPFLLKEAYHLALARNLQMSAVTATVASTSSKELLLKPGTIDFDFQARKRQRGTTEYPQFSLKNEQSVPFSENAAEWAVHQRNIAVLVAVFRTHESLVQPPPLMLRFLDGVGLFSRAAFFDTSSLLGCQS